MDKIRSVVLELVRPGPAHNQLLSPLTPYVALCGADSPVTVYLPFEHRQLLLRLDRLGYRPEDARPTEAQLAQRQGELQEIGETLGRVLGEIPALLAELSRGGCNSGRLMHLRLSLAGSELAMVPFETAISPAGFPGSGSALFLQTHTPICVTRETRRGRPLPLDWTREPRVLFVFAAPASLQVPFREHLQALREALRPWIRIKDNPNSQVAEVKKSLTVLPNASLQDIRDCCATQSFTHVHILAHGVPLGNSGDTHFGLALCRHDDKSKRDDVSGANLALALLGKREPGEPVDTPSLVSLAACESASQGSVLAPGGSIAHDLHAAGIPWVVASQFPLWISGSNVLVRDLYEGLLQGEDPRQVLYGARQRLRTDCTATHDWASIVVYAAAPPDFDRQVEDFRNAQVRRRCEVLLDRLDDLVTGLCSPPEGSEACGSDRPIDNERFQSVENELTRIADTLRARLGDWCAEARREDTAVLWSTRLANRLGLAAACDKRLGIAWAALGARTGDATQERQRRLGFMREAYAASRRQYGEALSNQPNSTWLMTQYLSMDAVLSMYEESDKNPRHRDPLNIEAASWWHIAYRLAEAEANRAQGRDHTYSLATLAELCLLASVYAEDSKQPTIESLRNYLAPLREHAKLDRIPVVATRRQLRRYARDWENAKWSALARKALEVLAEEIEAGVE